MPSRTFLNLPIDKQNTLLEAARNEFTRVLLSEASINRIIKEANIPRGSFYMYFEDKEDIYYYLLEKNRSQFIEKTRQIFVDNNGDIITCFTLLYDYLMSFCMTEDNKNFFKNVLMNINFKNEYPIFSSHNPEVMKKNLMELVSLIDKTNLNIHDNEDIFDLLNMIMMLTIHSLVKTVKHPELLTQNRKKYINQLRMLKHGVYTK